MTKKTAQRTNTLTHTHCTDITPTVLPDLLSDFHLVSLMPYFLSLSLSLSVCWIYVLIFAAHL